MKQINDFSRITKDELLCSGHLACPGCGGSLAMKLVLKALGKKTMVVLPACCWSVIAGPFPYSSLKVPLFHTAFEKAASVASGVRSSLNAQGKDDINVLAWAGDGGTFDIGLQALSGAAERNEDIIYICYDNEAYMNTGIQRSSATPWGAWTTTTPISHPKDRPKKDIMDIMAAHKIPYCANASVAFPEDLIRKVKKAASIKGMKFIHIIAPCTAGWKEPSNITIKVAREAVAARVFPLFEIEHGTDYIINEMPAKIPIDKYLSMQARFRHLKPIYIKYIQKLIDYEWGLLGVKAKNEMDNVYRKIFDPKHHVDKKHVKLERDFEHNG